MKKETIKKYKFSKAEVISLLGIKCDISQAQIWRAPDDGIHVEVIDNE